MKGLWTQKLFHFFSSSTSWSNDRYHCSLELSFLDLQTITLNNIAPALGHATCQDTLIIDAYCLLMLIDAASTGSSWTWFPASGARLSGVLFAEITQTPCFNVLAEDIEELFLIAVGFQVNQAAVCIILAGLLLQFKHHVGTATNGRKNEPLVWAWIPSRLSI